MTRAVWAAILVMPAGCLEVDEEWTFNPDGSGKVALRWVLTPSNFWGEPPDPEDNIKGHLAEELGQAKGVDCWKEVSCELRDDGKLAFRGTAYFKDASQLRIFRHGIGSDRHLSLTRTESGGRVVRFGREKPDEEEESEKEDLSKLSDDDWKKRLKRERFKFQNLRSVAEAISKDFRWRSRFHLPGKISKLTHLEKGSDSTAEFRLDGAELFKILDGVYADDRKLRERIERGKRTDRESLVEIPAAEVAIEGELKPLFDYSKEVTEEARAESAKLVKEFAPPEPAPPAPEPPRPSAGLDDTLRRSLVLDLSRPDPLALSGGSPEEFIAAVQAALENEELDYSLAHRNGSSSRSGGGKGRLVVTMSREADSKSVEELEYKKAGGERVLEIRQGAGECDVRLREPDGQAILIRRKDGTVQFMWAFGTRAGARAWPSMEEAFRRGAAEMRQLLGPLRELPVTQAVSPADAEVLELCAMWSRRPDAEVAEKMGRLRDRLADDDPETRAAAEVELSKLLEQSPLRLALVRSFEREAKDPQVRDLLGGLLARQRRWNEALHLVEMRQLFRDLEFLAGFIETEAAARRRLKELTGEEFGRAAEFDTWYQKNKARLAWDESAGRYRYPAEK
jgi:hypothetical protein